MANIEDPVLMKAHRESEDSHSESWEANEDTVSFVNSPDTMIIRRHPDATVDVAEEAGAIESFIQRTLEAEEQHTSKMLKSAESATDQQLDIYRLKLEQALDANKPQKAIRFAHFLHENDPADEDIEQLYGFLLERHGVPVREPVLDISASPVFTSVSGLVSFAVLAYVAIILLTEESQAFDIWTPLVFVAFASIPFVDGFVARMRNHWNRHRLQV